MADDSWVTPLITGSAGVFGALLGAGATHLGAKGREDRTWKRQRSDRLRDIRAQLYLDLTEFLENLFNKLSYAADDVRGSGAVPDVQPRERLTARVDLYGDEQLRMIWAKTLLSYDMIEAEWRDSGGMEEVSKETTSAAMTAIDQAQKLLRQLVGDLYS